MKFFRFILVVAIAIGWLYLLNTKIGKAPKAGPFLDPFHGFMANAVAEEPNLPENLSFPQLEGDVNVSYDDRLVPHIFAQNLNDGAFVQGYITASHRLWQMEFQTLAASGRLSEILGPDLLQFDREMRRIGLTVAAENAIEFILDDKEIMGILADYTAGVNAYMSSMKPGDLPIEYKLIGYKPEAWSPLKTALLLKYMGNYLTSREYDLEYSNIIRSIGKKQFDLLFDDNLGNNAPIIPSEKVWDFDALDIDTPDVHLWQDWLPQSVHERPDDNIGSNNWAVSASKAATDYPILCSDPHLQMNLPALWYEVQLSIPGQNVYGVSLPGSPGVIIGFNEDIAWGATNAGRDVRDWYHIKFTDETRSAYLYGDETRNTTIRIEEIKIRGAETFMDTVIYTHYGPVVYDKSFDSKVPGLEGLAQKWELLEPSNEMRMFFGFNSAKNYDDYREALVGYRCPAQNFIFASREGDIAISQQGSFPARWPGQGKTIMDGSDPLNDWQAYIPHDHNPHIKNPDLGFVSSANQHVADSTYPYYLSGFYEYHRNQRINTILDSMNNVTVEDLAGLQQDNFNMIASTSLPVMLKQIEGLDLSKQEEKLSGLLRDWDYFCEAEYEAPAIFQMWWDTLYVMIWDEISSIEGPSIRPNIYTTIDLMQKDPLHPFFDLKSTDAREGLKEITVLAFLEAVGKYNTLNPEGDAMTWREYKGTLIQHLARIPAFSRPDIDIGGYRHIVNATGSRQGPSWRMIVELDNEIRARGVYPGGQSGNPGSPYYDDFIDDWAAGNYYELLFLKSPEDRNDKIIKKIKFTN